MGRDLSIKGLSHLVETQLDSLEARTEQAETLYRASRSKLLRLNELETQHRARQFEKEDPKYIETKELGDISQLRVHHEDAPRRI